jgi:hypothetical protein
MSSNPRRCACLLLANLSVLTSACADRSEHAADTTSQTRAVNTSERGQTIDADSAGSVIRRYYEAIDERRFGDAYALWSDDGRASGKSLADFAAGFAETAHVRVQTGSPSRIEPAAGSRYITIPVTITATATSGDAQRFTGTYNLRRSVVDGASADQRAWRLLSANIHH